MLQSLSRGTCHLPVLFFADPSLLFFLPSSVYFLFSFLSFLLVVPSFFFFSSLSLSFFFGGGAGGGAAGKEWNSQQVVEKLTAPKVVTRAGAIIAPMKMTPAIKREAKRRAGDDQGGAANKRSKKS